MKLPPKSIAKCIELRDLAVALVRDRGVWKAARVGPQLLIYHDVQSRFTIVYRAPLQMLAKIHPPKPWRIFSATEEESLRSLPYGIDIWRGRKRLSVEWADDGRFNVINYVPGPWQDELRKLLSPGNPAPTGILSVGARCAALDVRCPGSRERLSRTR